MNRIPTLDMSTHIKTTTFFLALSEIDTKHIDITNPDDICTEEMQERYGSLLGHWPGSSSRA
eukprot:10584341-Prorocentrum_lima.AAC.1